MCPVSKPDVDVTVIIISVGRESLYDLIEGLRRQRHRDFSFEVVVIANGPVDEHRLEETGARVHWEDPGRGIPYYRNAGTRLAGGRVIVYIDDDETPPDDRWLSRLVDPILAGDEKVTEGGAFIPQGQGFLADLVSMLGYPGGASLGWRNVWSVDENGYTDKLCTCNCAIDKKTLEAAGGFHEGLALGASDLFLGEVFLESGVRMLFLDEATVRHEARGDFAGFVRWQVNRGRSLYDLRQVRPIRQFERSHVSGRLKRTGVILRRTFPGRQFLPMLGILTLEFALHGLGYGLRMLEARVPRRTGGVTGGRG